MSYNGTLARGTAAFAAGKFSNGLSGGVYTLPTLPSSAVGTIECWVKTTSATGVHVVVGGSGSAPNQFWIGINAGKAAFQSIAGATDHITAVTVSDGAWHHLALVHDGTNGNFYVDGVLSWQDANTTTFAPGAAIAIGGLGTNASFDWAAVGGGMVDEVRISSSVRYAGATVTMPSAAFTSDANTVALYHLEADGSDSATGAPTAPAQVTGLSATAGNALASLSWSAPANGGSAITDYTVQYRTTVGPGSWNTFAHGASTATSATVTGLTNGTGYDFQVAAVNAVGTGTYSTTASATPVALVNILPNDANIVYSPYNWLVTGSAAKTINSGAYFRTLIQGTPTAVNLKFDLTGIATPLPQVTVYVDGFSQFSGAVAASVTAPLPSGTTWTQHLVEVVVKSNTQTQTRWATQATAVQFLGVATTPNTCTTAAVQQRALRGLVYGDSITEGTRTLNSTATNDTDRDDATLGWAYRLTGHLGAEVGVVGFGSTGLTTSGSGGVPALPSSYNLLWAGQSRSFASAPDFIVILEGANDGTTNSTSAATTVLNALLAATPSTTSILVLRPFGGTQQATFLQAAVAACTTPSRVTYVDTAGWLSTADTSDSLHPYGYTDVTNIAPRVAAAIRGVLGAGKHFVFASGQPVRVDSVRV